MLPFRKHGLLFAVEHLERRTLLTAVVVNTVVDGLFPP
jgi:hypothetical protein